MRKELHALRIQLFAKDAEDELSSQTARTEDGTEVTSEDEGTKVGTKKVTTEKKDNFSVIKPAHVANVETGAKGVASTSIGSAPGMSTFKVGSYSGKKERSLVGDASSSQQVEGNYNPQGRFRKKVDTPIRDVNDMVSEQVSVDFKTLKSLSEDANSTEGYRGRIISDNALVQKNQGTQVAQKSMFRSVDEVKRDEVYFSAGQNVHLEGSDYLKAPFKGTNVDTLATYPSSQFQDGDERASKLERGNYTPRKLNIKLTKDDKGQIVVSDFGFDVDPHNVNIAADDVETANVSAVHSRVHGNYSELMRQKVEDVAGNEAAEGWSPLARAINEPTAFIGLMKDMEDDLGNTIGFAHRKLAESLSYQINRTGKDGLHIMRPIAEAATMLNRGEISSDDFEALDLFDLNELANGSAGLIVKMFDSVPKYDSKGTFLNLKRKSFANALSIAESNASGFRMTNDFKDTINQRQVFSTIGKDYDPSAPVYITDNVALTYPYDFNDFISIKDAEKNYLPHERAFGLGYSYKAPNNSYSTMVNHSLVSGLYDWVVNYRTQIFRALTKPKDYADTDEVTLSVPTVHSTTAISLWSIMLLHATPFMRRERIASMRELIDLENNHGPLFADRSFDLKTFWNTSPDNYRFSSIDEPLTTGRMKDQQALTWLMPEMFIPFDEISDDHYRMITPFYMNEQNVDFRTNGTWEYNNENASYSFPIIRAGITTDALDMFASFEPSEIRLAYDMLTLPPISNGAANTAHIYKYDLTTDGILAINEPDKKKITINDILTLPRQVGLSYVAPFGYLTKGSIGGTMKYVDKSDNFDGKTSYRVKMFYTANDDSPFTSSTIDAQSAVNQPQNTITKAAANLRQSWVANHAGDIDSGTVLGGLQLALNSSFAVTGGAVGDWQVEFVEGVSLITPFVKRDGTKVTDDVKEYRLGNLSNPYHLRLNQLPFILSPWDSVPHPKRNGEQAIKIDPFSFAHMFNFVGFHAVDYKEEVDIRIGRIQDQSMFFIRDKWVDDTFNKTS